MSKELIRHESLGSPEEIKFIITEVLSKKNMPIKDIKEFLMSTTRYIRVPIDGIIDLLSFLNLVDIEREKISINSDGVEFLKSIESGADFKYALISRLIDEIIKNSDNWLEFFDEDKIRYDWYKEKYTIMNDSFTLKYSPVKNLLIESNFLTVSRNAPNVLYIDNLFIEKFGLKIKEIHRRKSIQQLKDRQELIEKQGREAEEFVLLYELKRLSNHLLKEKVIRISEFDVSAGFDIISFETENSKELDRFIEVKSYSGIPNFFWSQNEIEFSKMKKHSYYLYLVDRTKMKSEKYEPIIIQNPFETVFCDEKSWRKNTETWHIIQLI
jgi:hypothetical protein